MRTRVSGTGPFTTRSDAHMSWIPRLIPKMNAIRGYGRSSVFMYLQVGGLCRG